MCRSTSSAQAKYQSMATTTTCELKWLKKIFGPTNPCPYFSFPDADDFQWVRSTLMLVVREKNYIYVSPNLFIYYFITVHIYLFNFFIYLY